MSAVLRIQRDGKVIQTHELREPATVGRGDGCVIRLEDHAISRKHAILSPDSAGKVIRFERKSDFGWIRHNGVEVTEGVAKPGDILEVGPFQIEISAGMESKVLAGLELPQATASAELAPAPEARIESHAALPDIGMVETASPSLAVETGIADVQIGEVQTSPDSDSMVSNPEGAGVLGDQTSESGVQVSDGTGGELDLALSAAEEPFPGVEGQTESPGIELGIETPGEAHAEEGISHPPAGAVQDKTSVFDPDGPTRLTPVAAVAARLVFAPGAANVDAFDLSGRDRVVVGRGGSGKPVDVELKDRKASRLHLEIAVRQGRYLLKDLGSPNGTYIDGQRMEPRSEAEIHSGARIRAGEAEFVFEVMSQDYVAKEGSFLPSVQQGLSDDAYSTGGDHGLPGFGEEQPLGASDLNFDPGIQGLGAPELSATQASGTGLNPNPPVPGGIKGLVARYKSYPPRTRLMFIAILAAVASLLNPEDEAPVKKAAKKKTAPIVSASGAPQGRTFEELSPEMQKQVMQGREQATNYYRAHEYENALNETKVVLSILPNDETAKTIAAYALKAIEKRKQLQEEENQRRADEERVLKIKGIVEELAALMEGARKKPNLPGKFDEVEQKINDSGITILDPNNTEIPKWQKEINAFREDQANIERARTDVLDKRQAAFANYRELEPLRQAALDAKEPADQIRNLGALFGKLLDIDLALPREEGGAYSDKVTAAEYKKIEELHRKVINELAECRSRVSKFMVPFVSEAQALETEAQASGEAAKYNDAFKKWSTVAQLEVLQQEAWLKQTGVEGSDSKGEAGMARIRGILNDRAKAIYTEGILAESYSDFSKAREKFEELQKIAPSDDLSVDSYFARARRKLAVYSQFDSALGRARQPAAEAAGAGSAPAPGAVPEIPPTADPVGSGQPAPGGTK